MDPVMLPSIIALGFLGLLFGSGLAFASKKFAVHVDPKVEHIIKILPGVNCGACGQPGCAGYAEAIVAGSVQHNKCAPGGQEIIDAIADIMGLAPSEAEEARVAVVHCQGDQEKAKDKFIYQGVHDCHAAILVSGGSKACKYGCLGLGSCARACPFDAIHMNDKGLPVIDEDKCTACGICVTTCPRDIISLLARSQKVFLGCVSLDKAKAVKSVCSVGCFACKICATPKVAPSGSIEMDGNLPIIKDITSDELFTAFERCPSNSYVLRGEKPEPQEEKIAEEKIEEN